MREPQEVSFPEFDFQSKASLKKCRSLNAEIAKVRKRRESSKRLADARPTADGTSFEQSFAKQDAKGNFIDSFLEEKAVLESAGDLVESLIAEAVQMVRENESNSNTAFDRIKAEIEAYGLIWANENQFNLFVRKSQAMAEFENAVIDAQQFERAARGLVAAIRSRCGWIDSFVVAERSKLVLVA